ncbi:MAG: sensor domain-containing diguanylate cyclase [Lachnospiraceae bacterium]|nr:GGDEF domain-containing protein [Candidatus Fimimorpha excrementavium]
MTKTERIRWKKSWTVTMGLILLIAAASFMVTDRINRIEEEKCFQKLYDEAGKLSSDIEQYIAESTQQLEMMASVIGRYDDLGSEQLWRIIDFYSNFGTLSKIEILMPDDTVLTNGGQKTEEENLSFETESDLGAHITGPAENGNGDGSHIVKTCVPVVKDQETIAMLYGALDLKNLITEINAQPYGNDAAIYLIEGGTGDFLVDTWHDEPGNIWELGERKMAPGYDHDQLKQGLINGKSGYVVFVSETIGEYLYFYYEPMDINDWRIALSVSESVVFDDANAIRLALNTFMMLETVCFALYLIWMFRQFHREMREKQRQMNILNYIYDVQKLLFNAHELQKNVIGALKNIGRMTSAETVGFWILGEAKGLTSFAWEDASEKRSDEWRNNDIVYRLVRYFEQKGMEFEARNIKEVRAKLPVGSAGKIRSLTAIPIEGTDGSICGVLAAFNIDDVPGTLAMLKNVSFSFSMLLQNMQSYNAIREKGEMDLLTGLYNRNRYEMDLREQNITYVRSLVCIYIDVNGLHELNNEKGHAAGDEMLKAVAAQIRARFGQKQSYRIGGDEFLVFVSDADEGSVSYQVKKAAENLKKENIYISAGIQRSEEAVSMDVLVKAAEEKMYEAKRRYYSQIHTRKERHLT